MTGAHAAVQVGCGGRAQAHARALTESDGFELVAVCDLDEERARETAEAHGVDAAYTDLHEAIAAESPAHVSVVTPPGVRPDVVEAVLEHGPDSLLMEKPVANTLPAVERVADAVAAAGTRATVCHQTVYADEVRAVAEWLDAGRLGDVRRLVGTTKHGLAGQGTHFVHMLDHLLGHRPDRVRGFAEGPDRLDPAAGDGHAEPGDAVFELDYGDATRAFLHEGRHAPDEPAQAGTFSLEYRLDVVGTEGHAQFVLGDHARGVFADGTTESVAVRPFDEDAYATRALYEDAAAVLDGERDGHPSDLESAVWVHRALDAVSRSFLSGRAVAPVERPAPLGTTTNERLRRRLAADRPIAVSSLLYQDCSRTEALDELADLGASAVDLWSVSSFVDHLSVGATDPETVRAELDARGLEVPVVSVYGDDPVEEKLAFAGALGADTVVTGGCMPERPETWEPDRLRRWLDVAAENDLTLAFENHLDTLETVGEMEALLDALDHPAAGVCLAPTHLHVAGGRAADAVARLGDAVEVLYLWDAEPGVTRETADEMWWERADSQVPGGGGAVDFERLLAAAVEHAPAAHWVLCYHGTEEWETDRTTQSVARSLRFLEPRRPR